MKPSERIAEIRQALEDEFVNQHGPYTMIPNQLARAVVCYLDEQHDDERAAPPADILADTVFARRDRWLAGGAREITHEVSNGEHRLAFIETVPGPLINGNESETTTIVAQPVGKSYAEALRNALDDLGAP